jgi:hypothetical protein
MIAYFLGNNMAIQSCGVICANCLKNTERATGMSICETFGMGLLGMAAPLVGAWLVTLSGGISVQGIRPLFFVSLGGVALTFLLVLTQVSDRNWGSGGARPAGFFHGYGQVFKQGRNLKRWLVIASLTGLPMGVVTPYVQPYAHDFKGADQFILGAMVTASAVVPLVFGIPFGRLSDRFGRKKIIYLTIPLVWASYLLLIFAPNSGFLIASGAFPGTGTGGADGPVDRGCQPVPYGLWCSVRFPGRLDLGWDRPRMGLYRYHGARFNSNSPALDDAGNFVEGYNNHSEVKYKSL